MESIILNVEEQQIRELEMLSDLFLMELYIKKTTTETITNLQDHLRNDVIVLEQADKEITTLQRTLCECIELIRGLNMSFALDPKLLKQPSKKTIISTTIYNAMNCLRKSMDTCIAQEREIDITKYKIAKFGEKRYAMLRDSDLSGDVDLCEICDYVGPTDYKIVSINSVGIFNKETKKVKLFK